MTYKSIVIIALASLIPCGAYADGSAYLRGVCNEYAKDGLTLAEIATYYLDDPQDALEFEKSCGKLHVFFKSTKHDTPLYRALNKCGRLSAVPYHACLDRVPKCETWITRDIDEYWHKGMTFAIDGASVGDPGIICQHGGGCIPLSAVRFKTSCTIIDNRSENISYYSWELSK